MMKYLTIVATLLFFSVSSNASSNNIDKARLSLKNYGLVYCLVDKFDEKSKLYEDIYYSASFYHYAGRGLHRITQNEDTLETLYDPYVQTENFIKMIYLSKRGISKRTGSEAVFGTCMKIYNSIEYDEFIRKQDEYID